MKQIYKNQVMTIANKYKWSNFDVFSPKCGYGWLKLLENAFAEIENNLGKHQIHNICFNVLDIRKDNDHNLKIYTANSTDKIDEIIRKAVTKTRSTCECCGNTIDYTSGLALCDECKSI